jgi:ATP-dependent helicase/DNAse subunit B
MCAVAILVPQCSHRWRKLTTSINPYSSQKKGCEYKFYTEFQSHEPEFDYLKSLEIEEKINKIKWCKRQNSAHFLLSTNGALHYYLLSFEA